MIGRYEILGELGSGAMATVHLARQLDLDRVVALKELTRIGLAESHVTASRFVREARLAGSLSHANVVTVYEYFEYEGRPYIAMEYVAGGSLRERLDGLSLSQIIGVLDGLLAALTHAEERAIVHRDIKPENILVTADGAIKIADFGIAKALTVASDERLTVAGAPIGTPMYMAPEQATGKPLSIATDLYAVGVVAFEMLFGDVPFGSRDRSHAVLWQHVSEPLPDMRARRPDLDARVVGWIEWLLAKDPAERPTSAAQAHHALEEIALELLGGRWRREALLPVRTGVSPHTPAIQPPRLHASAATDASAPGKTDDIPAAATRDASVSALAPLEQTEHYGRPHRDQPPAEPPAPGPPRWTIKSVGLVALASLVAAAGGYLAFAPGDPQDSPPSAAARRFAKTLDRTMKQLDATRQDERQQMRDATSADAQAAHARAVASAYRLAAETVGRLAPEAAQRVATSRLVAALDRGRRTYVALAQAAATHSRRRYDRQAETVVAQEEAVRRAFAQIPRAG